MNIGKRMEMMYEKSNQELSTFLETQKKNTPKIMKGKKAKVTKKDVRKFSFIGDTSMEGVPIYKNVKGGKKKLNKFLIKTVWTCAILDSSGDLNTNGCISKMHGRLELNKDNAKGWLKILMGHEGEEIGVWYEHHKISKKMPDEHGVERDVSFIISEGEIDLNISAGQDLAYRMLKGKKYCSSLGGVLLDYEIAKTKDVDGNEVVYRKMLDAEIDEVSVVERPANQYTETLHTALNKVAEKLEKNSNLEAVQTIMAKKLTKKVDGDVNTQEKATDVDTTDVQPKEGEVTKTDPNPATPEDEGATTPPTEGEETNETNETKEGETNEGEETTPTENDNNTSETAEDNTDEEKDVAEKGYKGKKKKKKKKTKKSVDSASHLLNMASTLEYYAMSRRNDGNEADAKKFDKVVASLKEISKLEIDKSVHTEAKELLVKSINGEEITKCPNQNAMLERNSTEISELRELVTELANKMATTEKAMKKDYDSLLKTNGVLATKYETLAKTTKGRATAGDFNGESSNNTEEKDPNEIVFKTSTYEYSRKTVIENPQVTQYGGEWVKDL